RRRAVEFFVNAENGYEFVGQSHARRRAVKEVKVVGKELPDLAVGDRTLVLSVRRGKTITPCGRGKPLTPYPSPSGRGGYVTPSGSKPLTPCPSPTGRGGYVTPSGSKPLTPCPSPMGRGGQGGDAEGFHGDALGVEHSENIVVGEDQQVGRCAER